MSYDRSGSAKQVTVYTWSAVRLPKTAAVVGVISIADGIAAAASGVVRYEEGREGFGALDGLLGALVTFLVLYGLALAVAWVWGRTAKTSREQSSPVTVTTVPSMTRGLVEDLRQLTELHNSGALTDEQFETAKARLLSAS